MKKIFYILAIVAACSCAEKPDDSVSKLDDPVNLSAEQTDIDAVTLTWTDKAQGEKGYRVYKRNGNSNANTAPVVTLPADAVEYTFTGLTAGAVMDFGVQAIADDFNSHSNIVYAEDVRILTLDELYENGSVVRVAAPSEVSAVQEENKSSVVLSWKDNAQDETGYSVYMRKASDESFGKPAANLSADVKTYTFTNVSGGEYVFGVQAKAANAINDSEITATEVIDVLDYTKVPEITSVKTSYAYVAVSYKVQKLNGANPEHGVCFSAEGEPTVDDIKALGPNITSGTEILQVVPNAYLDVNKEYQMRVFVKDGDKYRYSAPQTVKLDAQPDLPQLTWEKQTYSGLAEGIEIYKTTSQLGGRNFNAWYAIADPTKVDFKVLYPETVGEKKTIAAQAEAAEGCQVLINGAIFGNYNIGVIMTEGEMTQKWHGEIEGCYWGTDEQLYQLTRAIIGVDKNGKADAYWVGVPEQGTFYYYDRPQTNVVGQAKYGKVSATSPVPASAWDPYYAISCGPMVLYDGKLAADNSSVDNKGERFYTNYECWSETGVYYGNPDRTAVGITADGKIVLFVCDGRIDASKGAYIPELGQVMKSIGCVHAMNLDGGGSTGMWVNGAGMINYKDNSWRAVKSTLGFFKK